MTVLYLASTSPRRHELLRQIGVDFKQVSLDQPEPEPESTDSLRLERVEAFVSDLAVWKATQGRLQLPELDQSTAVVMGSDTMVFCNGSLMGKPMDETAAEEMLWTLSGAEHQVCSAVALVCGERAEVKISTSHVRFKTLTMTDITSYLKTEEFRGKAGAYAIQGRAALFVERIVGSYSGIMGLPLFETGELLTEFDLLTDC